MTTFFGILALASEWRIATTVAVVIVFFMLIATFAQFFGLWLQAYMSNAGVSMIYLLGMRLRKVDARIVTLSRIRAVKAGLDISMNDIETHVLAGGDVVAVINALIAAERANIELPWKKACAIDLAGQDIAEIVRDAVDPAVFDLPQ